MLYVFEMDFGLGGTVRPAPPHPGLAAWTELLEDWVEREELSERARLTVMTAAAELGSEWAGEKLEAAVVAIDDMDGPEWTENDTMGHTLSHALRAVRRRNPFLPSALVEKVIRSARYNIAAEGINALRALGDADALKRLIDLHEATPDWHLRDHIANAVELIGARQGVVIQKVADGYRLGSQKPV